VIFPGETKELSVYHAFGDKIQLNEENIVVNWMNRSAK
jgi:hypothetical protein